MYVFSEQFPEDIRTILHHLERLVRRSHLMAGTLADLDAEIAKNNDLDNSLLAQLQTNSATLDRLSKASQAGVDVSAELLKMKAQNDTLSTAIQTLNTQDAATPGPIIGGATGTGGASTAGPTTATGQPAGTPSGDLVGSNTNPATQPETTPPTTPAANETVAPASQPAPNTPPA